MSAMRNMISVAVALSLATTASAITTQDLRDLFELEPRHSPADPLGQQVTLDNIVLNCATDMVNSSNSKSIYFQDATGGINVYGTNAEIDSILAEIEEGDAISLTGHYYSYNGLLEIIIKNEPFSFTKVGSPGVPAAQPVTIADFQDNSPTAEGFESELVILENVEFAASGYFGYGNYNVSAPGTSYPSVTVRIAAFDHPLVGQPIPSGPVDVRGIFTQYDGSPPYTGGYQLYPRHVKDIIGPPIASSITSSTIENTSGVTIALSATHGEKSDENIPLVYEIVSGPVQHYPAGTTIVGTIEDAVTSANLTNGGTLSNGNAEVVYTPPAGVSGWFSFTYKATDDIAQESNEATVHVLVQDADSQVVITEIMYNPNNFVDIHWEWIEVKNTGTDATLYSVFDTIMDSRSSSVGNFAGQILPGGSTKILLTEWNYSRQLSDFLSEWSIGSGDVLTANPTVPNAKYLPPLDENDDNGEFVVLIEETTGNVLDVVHYMDGLDGWPKSNDRGSIFVVDGAATVADNDLASNWQLSVYPTTNSNVIETTETAGPPEDQDNGSPMAHPTGPTTAYTPPEVWNDVVHCNEDGGAVTIELPGEGNPDTESITFKITGGFMPIAPTTLSGSAVGSLTDPNNGGSAVALNSPLAGKQVDFTPAPGVSGLFYFTFKASDGSSDSNLGYIMLMVQDDDSRVIITEMHYNPGIGYDSEWEYLEITNLTGSAISLHSYWDGNWYPWTRENWFANLMPNSITGGQTLVITRQDTGARTLADFGTVWFPFDETTSAVGVDAIEWWQWPSLNNGNETLLLVGADGTLLDVVQYDNAAPWPDDDGYSSVYLLDSGMTSLGNDDPANWALSQAGVDNARYTTDNLGTPGYDTGSPGLLPSDPSPFAPADFDFDLDVDTESGLAGEPNDWEMFEACATGPGVAYDPASLPSLTCKMNPDQNGKIQADFDKDGDVDHEDFAVFQKCFSGTDIQADNLCAN